MRGKDNCNPIDSIFRLRESLIILGLTGRTGAGCSTVASILSRKSFDELDLKSYKTFDFNNADERKYSIIYRFMQEGEKWVPFYVIEASTIIFSFIAESTFKDFFDFLDKLESGDGCQIGDLDKIKAQFYNEFSDCDEDTYRKDDQEQLKKKIFPELISLKGTGNKKNETGQKADISSIRIVLRQYCKIPENEPIKEKTLKEQKDRFRKLLLNHYFMEEKETDGEKEIKVHALYSYVMQTAGNNIRKSGNYLDEKEQPGNEIAVAERIDKLIKLINKYEEEKPEVDKNEKKVRICIDALRTTFEIQYFRDKYRAFYAVAVNTEDKDRVQRLETHFNKEQLSSLDDMEYPEEKAQFFKQNIQGCLEISDIYLYNPNVADHKYYVLTAQLIKYITLMLHPGLVAPTHLERCMQLAFNAKCNSGCLSRKVGAVVTGNDFSIRSVGWNDVPKGQVPCNLRCVEDYCKNKDAESFSEFELTDRKFGQALKKINAKLRENKNDETKNLKGKTFQYCFKDIYIGMTGEKNQVYTRALHAEENAFLQIAKYGGAEIRGGKLFTTASPCELCSKKAYQLGIKEIYYIDPYPGISKTHILSFGKNDNPQMILFQGAIGNAYISLYSPRIPYKDELELQTGFKVKDEVKGAD